MRYALLAGVMGMAGLVGCGVSSYIVKQVSIEKDPEGKILKRTETEYVIQAVNLEEITMELIKIQKPIKPEASDWK